VSSRDGEGLQEGHCRNQCPLAPLFRRNWPQIDVYDTLKDEAVEWPAQYEIDAHIHISWLGRYYRKTDADFPKDGIPDRRPGAGGEVARVSTGLPEAVGRPSVARRDTEDERASRSLQLADLAPLIESGGAFFSLAYQQVGLEVARWNIEHPQQVICPT
jgi:hypothetical protein